MTNLQVREFFDMDGSSLSDEQEFVHYYALPFVSDPSSHPTFKPLFQVPLYQNFATCYKSNPIIIFRKAGLVA